VVVWVVGGVGLPAVPDDVQPSAGKDAYGVGVIVSAGAGAVVEIGGPGVGDGNRWRSRRRRRVVVCRSPSETRPSTPFPTGGSTVPRRPDTSMPRGGETATAITDFGTKAARSRETFAWPSQPALKDCGLSPRVSVTPSSFAAKQPVRKPPWLTAHFSNLADLMERRGPHPPLSPFSFADCPAQQQYSRMIVHIVATERDMLCPTVEYSTG
jgi:hypothetical protein